MKECKINHQMDINLNYVCYYCLFRRQQISHYTVKNGTFICSCCSKISPYFEPEKSEKQGVIL